MAERGLEMLNTTPEQFNQSDRRDFEVITKRMQEFGIEAQCSSFSTALGRPEWRVRLQQAGLARAADRWHLDSDHRGQ
ncbi:hypothetical protein [Variovorax sp. J22R115]|uniref:hypothetical protein n=1 Tax=Variovorax sp. J22R115 TaxID=3053509 RepID=UPI002574D79E|nr:hypothetical protein [Variovorax sp. J22R115]MDM0050502.1 hypothetical protein [Variovorax sp. J22R115]